MIELKNIEKSFNGKKIFHDLSLSINSGEKIAITGPSGMGKSTLLELIPGFILPDKGKIFIEGRQLDPKNVSDFRKRIFWMPQSEVKWDGTALSFILAPFRFKQNQKIKPDISRISEILEKLNLDKNILGSDYTDLSGGEKQRLSLAVGKLLNRGILLLDEPGSALDQDSESKAIDLFLRDESLTVLAVTHSEKWAACSGREVRL